MRANRNHIRDKGVFLPTSEGFVPPLRPRPDARISQKSTCSPVSSGLDWGVSRGLSTGFLPRIRAFAPSLRSWIRSSGMAAGRVSGIKSIAVLLN